MLRLPGVSRIRVISILANAVLVSALLPYLSPFPIAGMDVQPTAVCIAVLSLLFLALVEPWRITVCRADLVVFAIGLFVLFYVDFLVVPVSFAWVRDCGIALFSFPVYFAVRNLYRHMSPWVFCTVVGFYLVGLLVEAAAPGLYRHTFARLLSDVRFGDTGGLNGLAPEPSYIGDLSVLFCVALYFFHPEFWREHRKTAWFVVISSAAMVFISQSATGFAGGAAVALLAGIASRHPFKVKVAGAAALLFVLVVAGPILVRSNARGSVFLSSLIEKPSAALDDVSLVMRFAVPSLSMAALPSAPLGTGTLSLEPGLLDKALGSRLVLAVWPSPALRGMLLEWVTYRAEGSSFGFSIQRMGVFSLVVLLILLSLVGGFRGQWIIRVFLIAYVLNASLFISTIWLTIGSCVAIRRNRRRSTDIVRTDVLIEASEAS